MTKVCLSPNPLTEVSAINKTVLNANNLKSRVSTASKRIHILSENNMLETWEEMTKVCLSPNPLTEVSAINKTVLNANNLKSRVSTASKGVKTPHPEDRYTIKHFYGNIGCNLNPQQWEKRPFFHYIFKLRSYRKQL